MVPMMPSFKNGKKTPLSRFSTLLQKNEQARVSVTAAK